MREGIKLLINKLMELDKSYEVLDYRMEFKPGDSNINISANLIHIS